MLEFCPIVPEISMLTGVMIIVITILLGLSSPSKKTIQKAGFGKFFKLKIWFISQVESDQLTEAELKKLNRFLVLRWLLLTLVLVLAISAVYVNECVTNLY